jgi:hypothetical protein
MSENKTTKTTVKSKVMYALSIHMKYGEVLHIEGLNKEEKDKYFELARREDSTMLVEDKTSVIHLLSRDIAKISVKAYDEKYERMYHPLEKMVFSESSVGRRPFSFIIKTFIVLAILSIVSAFGVAMLSGNIMDVFFDKVVLTETLTKGFDLMNKIFTFTAVLLIMLSIIDIGLGYKAHYYINQDGSDPVEYSRISNLVVSIAFIVVFMIVKSLLATVVTML